MDRHQVDKSIPLIAAFPLPFQIFSLVGLAILAWATNLHILDLTGLDITTLMDLRMDIPQGLPAHNRASKPTRGLVSLYHATYRIFLAYSLLCFTAWFAYRYATYGDLGLVDLFGYIPGIATLLLIAIMLCPFNVLHKTERRKFLHATWRCLISSGDDPIYFCDVILADIFTSFAQVIGDVWLSICTLMPGHSLLNPSAGQGLTHWMLPTIMSLPYLIRFRQCIIEGEHQGNISFRPFYNALKYATAFPVIYLSAALAGEKDLNVIDSNKKLHGNGVLFRFWFLAALVNSLYSFWWDITNDWGFELLKLPLMKESIQVPVVRKSDDTGASSVEIPQTIRETRRGPYGLRSTLRFPLVVYPILITLNLALRLVWSMKLFSVINVKNHAGPANFFLKSAELFRRWLWVFVRVEWEIVRRDIDGCNKVREGEGEYELVSRG